MFKIQIPESVRFIIQTIEQAGFEAYAVGGCVRDTILGRIPDDWDITTSAKPEEIKRLFKHTIDTGIQHGTVTVLINKECYEVTTYRIDGEYEDSRHPKEVNFTSLLSEDLRRRDFTINAMAYNEDRGIVDLFGGQEDLKAGIIRCVGNPEERFSEDALRIMRAVRFSAQLGYEIEENTCRAIKKLAHTLERISVERIQVELIKLLVSAHPEYVMKMYELGLTKVFLPEFDLMIVTNPYAVEMLKAVSPNKISRLTALFYDKVGSETVRKILKRLRFDNDTIQRVSLLILHYDHDNEESVTAAYTRRLIHKVGLDNITYLVDVKRAEALAQKESVGMVKLEKAEALAKYYQEVLEQGLCVSLKDLAISGGDLIKAGMKPGQELGRALEQMLEIVLEDPSMNEKGKLLDLVKDTIIDKP